jgi:hypothetical protein
MNKEIKNHIKIGRERSIMTANSLSAGERPEDQTGVARQTRAEKASALQAGVSNQK